MKIRTNKRFGAIILAFMIMLALIPAAIPGVLAAEAAPQKTFKVFFIGNSYTDDTVAYLYDIAYAAGYRDVIVGAATIGSASIESHYNNAVNGQAKYTYSKTKDGKKTSSANQGFRVMLQDEDWDTVILQEQSSRAGQPVYYDQNGRLTGLIEYIRETMKAESTASPADLPDGAEKPEARIGWFMTWAYAEGHETPGFDIFGKDQMTMYNAVANAVKTNIEGRDDIDFIVPAGTVIQNARTSYLGDTLNRDGTHMVIPNGRYLAGLSAFRAITGDSLYNYASAPGSIKNLSPGHWPMFQDAVEDAFRTPYDVTASRYPPDDGNDEGSRPTNRPTDQPTNRPTDQPTQLLLLRTKIMPPSNSIKRAARTISLIRSLKQAIP